MTRLRSEVAEAASEQGVGWRTVETAKSTLGVTDHQVPVPGRRGAGPSHWALPTPSGNEMEMGGLECDRNGSQG